MNEAYADFVARYPAYLETTTLDELRATEYYRLDEHGQVYLDYTGGSLYGESQLQQHLDLLRSAVFGNPHSANPASTATTGHVERTRRSVLEYFNAARDYIVVFTLNASGALKLIGESFPFAPGSRYLATFDNHNSVNGIREFARAKGATLAFAPLVTPSLRLDRARLESLLDQADPARDNLFAYPAQSNFSGVKHPPDLVATAQSKGWQVLLDAAAFVPTNRLDLAAVKPDFVCVSFYKMFGYPTGVGALIARREALAKLHRPWFAGGTITVVSVQGDKFYMADGHTAFEDGTPDYLNIPAVEIGLKHIESIGYDVIHERVMCLTGWLLSNLIQMKHSTGEPLVRVFGPTSTEARGGAVTVNFFDKDGKPIDHRFIESEANKVNISLRTGCFCNPGAGEIALGLSRVELDVCFTKTKNEDRLSLDDFRLCFDGKSTGAVRISVGMVTNFNDVQAFLSFARGLLQ